MNFLYSIYLHLTIVSLYKLLKINHYFITMQHLSGNLFWIIGLGKPKEQLVTVGSFQFIYHSHSFCRPDATSAFNNSFHLQTIQHIYVLCIKIIEEMVVTLCL